MNKLSVQLLDKIVDGKSLLAGVSFEASPGSITVIIGPSGAGKSTLLRALCQLETIDGGQIHLNGKTIGMVFQQYHLWKHLTLLENCILAPILVHKISKEKAIREALLLFEQLGILDKQHHYPHQLSGGEQQRGAIARALIMKPDILLFDEPTAALDPKRTDSIVNIIQSLALQGITIIVVTHDTVFAHKIATQIILLEAGKIVEQVCMQKNAIFTTSEILEENI